MVESISLDNPENVYDRQSRIDNWNQEKIRTKVLITGQDILSEMVLGCLLGIGIEDIFIFDKNPDERTSFLIKDKKRNSIEQIIETGIKINPRARIRGFDSRFSKERLTYEDFNPNFVVDLTNSKESKEKSLEYAIEKGIVFISAYCNRKKLILSAYNPEQQNIEKVLESNEILNQDNRQGVIPAGIGAGIVTDEIRKALFRINDYEDNLKSRIIYNLESSTRTSLESDLTLKTKDLHKKRVLVAGAGAIGNFAVLSLALSGFREIDIMDFDHIDLTNLNRQILFYERLGKPKAEVLSERIKELRDIKSKPINHRIDENSEQLLKQGRYDLILGCFDNLEARYWLNEFAVKLSIPYIDGGTSHFMGSIYSYYPKQTPCIKCKKDLKPIKAQRTCARTLPSVVIPNMITGSAMTGEAVNLISGNISNNFVYDGSSDSRIYIQNDSKSKEGCACKN